MPKRAESFANRPIELDLEIDRINSELRALTRDIVSTDLTQDQKDMMGLRIDELRHFLHRFKGELEALQLCRAENRELI